VPHVYGLDAKGIALAEKAAGIARDVCAKHAAEVDAKARFPKEAIWAGIEYKIGAFTPRVVWSHGEYENPGGSQDIFLVGGTVALTSWLTLYLEYVDWIVQADGGPEITFENGVQIVLNWNV
jgi:hypothetical protein